MVVSKRSFGLWNPQCVDDIRNIESEYYRKTCQTIGYSDLLHLEFHNEIQYKVKPHLFTSIVVNNDYKNLLLRRNSKTIMERSKTNETCFTVRFSCY